jgi:HAD superfamily hydrolase (TIGR01509 family)
MGKITGLIFDFNGTLLFDGAAHTAAWKAFLQEKTGHLLTDREMLEQVQGRPNPEILRHFLGDLTEAEVARLSEEKEEKYRELCLQPNDWFRLAPGVEELFDRLQGRLPFTIATSSEWGNVAFYFAHLGIGRWFTPETVVFADGKMAGKPAPDIYRKAMALLGKAPEECAVFEDSLAGILSAKNAGAGKIVGIASDWSREKLLQVDGVTDVISDFRMIEENLNWLEID